MVAIFTRTTSVLSTQFVEKFTCITLSQNLFQVQKDTGVEFYRKNETVSIAGHWAAMVKAHQTLEQIYSSSESVQNKGDREVCDLQQEGNCEPSLSRKTSALQQVSENGKRGRKPGSSTTQKSPYAAIPEPFVFQIANNVITAKKMPSDCIGGVVDCHSNPDPSDLINLTEKNAIVESVDNNVKNSEAIIASDIDSMPFRSKKIPANYDDICLDKKGGGIDTETVGTSAHEAEVYGEEGNKSENRDDLDDSSTDVNEKVLKIEALTKQNDSVKEYDNLVMKIKVETEEFPNSLNDNIVEDMGRGSCVKSGERISQMKNKSGGHDSEIFCCTDCNYVTHNRENLKSHKKRKHRAKKFSCDVCNRQFGLNKDMQRHKRQVHCRPAYSCNICERSYKSKVWLKLHMKTHIKDESLVEKIKESVHNDSLEDTSEDVIDTETVGTRAHEVEVDGEEGNESEIRDDLDDSSTDVDEKVLTMEASTKQKLNGSVKEYDNLVMKIKVETEEFPNSLDDNIVKDMERGSCVKSGERISQMKNKSGGHDSENYGCTDCNYVTHNRGNLKSHKKRKHRAKKFTCDVCNRQFGLNKDMQRHKRQVHCRPAYSCNICERLYKCKTSLTVHMKTHIKDESQVEKIKESVLNDSLEDTSEDCLSCKQCDYVGTKKYLLKEHQNRMHRSKFSCDECGKTFGYNKDLNRHKRLVHSELAFVCQICKKFYRRKLSYENHLQTHKDNYVKENFNCEMCPKTFSTKYVLTAHVKSEHLGIKKSFVCPICSKSFTQKSSYLIHAYIHAGIKAHVCDICGMSFTHESSYKYHKLTHGNTQKFPCTVCEKVFAQLKNLRIHMQVHQNKRDHLCAVCGKGFTQKQALIRHERIHTGDKPFVCDLCQRSFTDNSIIRRHLILMHKKDSKNWKQYTTSYVKNGP